MIDEKTLEVIARNRWTPQFLAGIVLMSIRNNAPVQAKSYMGQLLAIVNRPVPESEVLISMIAKSMDEKKPAGDQLAEMMLTIIARPIARQLILELTGPEREILGIPSCFI